MRPTFHLASAVAAAFCLAPSSKAQQPIALERVVLPGSGLQEPVDIQCIPGDDRLCVVERGGLVKVVVGGDVLTQPFADVSGLVTTAGDVGLRGIAFDPEYAANGRVFLWFDAETAGDGVDGVLVRLERDASDPLRTDPASLVEVLRVPQDGSSHGGGRVGFAPDGMLLLGIGDGTPGGDPYCRAQDRTNLQGTMLRIDVRGDLPYGIPPDNPFVGEPDVRPEILHYGLRHPWKWSIDPSTGDLWIGDVGQESREEVSFARADQRGLNFGWPAMEGSACYAGSGCADLPSCTSPDLVPPVFEYTHGLGCSITGGYFCQTTSLPDLNGSFVFTDFCSHRIWSARREVSGTVNVIEHSVSVYPSDAHLSLPTTFGLDSQGELLVADFADGEIYRVAPAESFIPVCDGMPNVTGAGASMSPTGSSSLSRNDMGFVVHGTAPFTLGVLFYGPDTAAVPAGNGMRCVSSGSLAIFRADVSIASSAGTLSYPVDLFEEPFSADVSQVQAGSTWVFQTWYRDVGGPLGASTNFSGAVAARFRP